MTLVDALVRSPWERQAPHESNRAYHAFTDFLHLPAWSRTMSGAYTHHRRVCKQQTQPKPLHAPKEWNAYRLQFSWRERAEAHDADVAARDRLRKIADIEQMNARHASLAVAIQNQVILRLQKLIEDGEILKMTATQLAHVLDKASLVERRSRGLPGEIVQHQQAEATGGLLDLSRLSSADLAIFETLVQRCTREESSPDAD